MLKVGVIVLGCLPSGVKQILHRLYENLSPAHQLFGLEIDRESGEITYTEVKEISDAPYLSHSILKVSATPSEYQWEEAFAPMDMTVVMGDAVAKELWQASIAKKETIRTLFVPVSIYNNIRGNDWTLGYDTALNSITQNVLKVQDTIQSLKYDKPRLFGFSIEGNPSTNMLQDISLAVDGNYLAVDYEKEEIAALCEAITKSYTYTKTSSVLIYSESLQAVVQDSVISKLDVDWKYTEINEALCMGTNPTAIDRILANELADEVLRWTNNNCLTGELVVHKDGIQFK
ncbi:MULTISPECIES: 6-phosphofructokinase [unclassified Bacillus (in: firmicutes)]|uniref:6-phosphofructokinase n=1 Tax=unclassified Bacillus (in: firmicutes) TaxID=185979 RepID=UPI001E4D6D86|nr:MULTISPECIES: 6-phosphofructokinase [unclassified Bacillus (in: firmicutes)]